MQDLVQEAHAIAMAHHATEKTEISMQAMEAAFMLAETECQKAGQVLLMAEFTATREKYYRIEAAKLGMTPTEIDNYLCVHSEIMKLVERISMGVSEQCRIVNKRQLH